MDDDVAERPDKTDLLRPSSKGVVCLGILRHHHNILVHSVIDSSELKIAHLVGEPAQIVGIQGGCEVLDAGLATTYRPEVDHKS